MNYYPHHIGDFDRDTRHLTLTQRGAYRELLDLYYKTEQPLKADVRWLCKRVCARSVDEIEAIEFVLEEFFYLAEKGYENPRCNSEIAKYRSTSKSRSKAGKISAQKRREKKALEAKQAKLLKDNEKKGLTRVEHVYDKCSFLLQQNSTNQNHNQNHNQNQKNNNPAGLVNPSAQANALAAIAQIYISEGDKLRFIKALAKEAKNEVYLDIIADAMQTLSHKNDNQPIAADRAIPYCKGAVFRHGDTLTTQ